MFVSTRIGGRKSGLRVGGGIWFMLFVTPWILFYQLIKWSFLGMAYGMIWSVKITWYLGKLTVAGISGIVRFVSGRISRSKKKKFLVSEYNRLQNDYLAGKVSDEDYVTFKDSIQKQLTGL